MGLWLMVETDPRATNCVNVCQVDSSLCAGVLVLQQAQAIYLTNFCRISEFAVLHYFITNAQHEYYYLHKGSCI